MRVLVAEDDAFARCFLERTLRKWSYEVVLAADGRQAMEILLRDDAPQLAILDWIMPGCDGIDVCRRVKSTLTERLTYLIMLTSKSEVESLVEAMEAGADDFVTKSFDVRELQVRLRAGERIVRAEAMLRKLATQDALTGLCNRRVILDILQRELDKTSDGNGPSIIMLDLDHFKNINDTLGHPAGDAVLTETGKRILSDLPQHCQAGRYGGEEFLVVLPGTDAIAAGEIAEALRLRLCSEKVVSCDDLIACSASFGVACPQPDQRPSLQLLLKQADEALYEAKASGRNRVAIAGSSLALARAS